MSVLHALECASRSGKPIRVHTRDGEVIVAKVLSCDSRELIYAPLSSSRPERYAVCDSTGFRLPLDSIERVQLLRQTPPAGPGPRRGGSRSC